MDPYAEIVEAYKKVLPPTFKVNDLFPWARSTGIVVLPDTAKTFSCKWRYQFFKNYN